MTAATKAIQKGAEHTEIIGTETINGSRYEISRHRWYEATKWTSEGFTLYAENLDDPSTHIWTLTSTDCEPQTDEDGDEYLKGIPCTVEELKRQIEWKAQNPDGLSRMGVAVRVPYLSC